MKAIILAAGKSKRLQPFSATRPKSMIFLAGEHILETTLTQLKEAGITEVLLVVGHQRQVIQDYFHYGKKLGIKLDYVVQENPASIGNALLMCREKIKDQDHFMLVYGDVLTDENPFFDLIETYQRDSPSALAGVTHPRSKGNFGNVYLNHEMKINRFIEKPEDSTLSNYVFSGHFILPQKAFSSLEKNNGNMVELLQELISQEKMSASLWENGWIDISRPWQILSANQMKMESWKESKIAGTARIESNVNIQGVVHIGENVLIRSGTTIVGPCYIGDNVYIGNNALLRENSSIGPGCKIGYGTEIKNAVLFGNSNIGRLSFIGDSVLGNHVQLGSGTITINYITTGGNIPFKTLEGDMIDTGKQKLGAFIGCNAQIGSGHTLAPGIKIEPERKVEDHISIKQ